MVNFIVSAYANPAVEILFYSPPGNKSVSPTRYRDSPSRGLIIRVLSSFTVRVRDRHRPSKRAHRFRSFLSSGDRLPRSLLRVAPIPVIFRFFDPLARLDAAFRNEIMLGNNSRQMNRSEAPRSTLQFERDIERWLDEPGHLAYCNTFDFVSDGDDDE